MLYHLFDLGPGSRLGGMEAGSYKHSVEFVLQAGSRQLSRPAKPGSYKQVLQIYKLITIFYYFFASTLL